VTPIRELDGRTIGIGRRGPMTTRIQKAFFDVVNGRNRKYKGWLTPVAAARKSPARKTAKRT
jgi:branched-chain amino acid aminotransferase